MHTTATVQALHYVKSQHERFHYDFREWRVASEIFHHLLIDNYSEVDEYLINTFLQICKRKPEQYTEAIITVMDIIHLNENKF